MTELNNSIFYHIIKTGGTWVKAALKEAYHGDIKTYKKHLKEKDHPKGNKKAFSFVRHPVSWFESLYWFTNTTKYGVGEDVFCDQIPLGANGLVIPKSYNIDETVRRVTKESPGWFTNLVKESLVNIDYVGMQETLAENLVEILDLIEEPYDKELLSATPPYNVTLNIIRMNQESRELLMESERYIIDRFYRGVLDEHR